MAHVHGMYVARVALGSESGPRWTAVTWLESPDDLTQGPEQAFYTEIDANAWAIATLHAACGSGRVITGRRIV